MKDFIGQIKRSFSRTKKDGSKEGGSDLEPSGSAGDLSSATATAKPVMNKEDKEPDSDGDGEPSVASIKKLENQMSGLVVENEGQKEQQGEGEGEDAAPGGGDGGTLSKDNSLFAGGSSMDFGAGSYSFLGGSANSSAKWGQQGSLGGGDDEGVGPPEAPPLFQSGSSVNVYMPTKLRKAGSMGTGTYADPANSTKQDFDERRRDRTGLPPSHQPPPQDGQLYHHHQQPPQQQQQQQGDGQGGVLHHDVAVDEMFQSNGSMGAVVNAFNSNGSVTMSQGGLDLLEDLMVLSSNKSDMSLTFSSSRGASERIVTISQDVESPVFSRPVTSPDPRRFSGGGSSGSISREPSQGPNLSAFDSNRSIDWFNSEEGATLPHEGSYINAFEKEEHQQQQHHPPQHHHHQQQQQQQQSGAVDMSGSMQPPRPPVWVSPYMQHQQQHHHHHQGQGMPPRPTLPPQGQHHHQGSPPSPDPDDSSEEHTSGGGGRSSRQIKLTSKAQAAKAQEDFDYDDRKGSRTAGDKKGRYKCRYCGEIKKQHICPALIDIPRVQSSTQVDLDLTAGQGGMTSSRPIIPHELRGCRLLPVRGSASGALHPSMVPVIPPSAPLTTTAHLSMQIPVVPPTGPPLPPHHHHPHHPHHHGAIPTAPMPTYAPPQFSMPPMPAVPTMPVTGPPQPPLSTHHQAASQPQPPKASYTAFMSI